MLNKKRFTKNSLMQFGLASAIGLVLSSAAFAYSDSEEGERSYKHKMKMHKMHDQGMRSMGGFGKLRHAFSQLDLSDAQRDELKALKQNNSESINAGKEAIYPMKSQMKELLMADEIDETAVKDLAVQIAEKKADQMLLIASIKKQAIAILTDEQRTELEQMKEKRQRKHASHH